MSLKENQTERERTKISDNIAIEDFKNIWCLMYST